MTNAWQSTLVMLSSPMLFLAAGLYLGLHRGWPLRAGGMMLIAGLLPAVWLFTLPTSEVDVEGAGSVLLIYVFPMVLIALLVLLITAGSRAWRRVSSAIRQRRNAIVY